MTWHLADALDLQASWYYDAAPAFALECCRKEEERWLRFTLSTRFTICKRGWAHLAVLPKLGNEEVCARTVFIQPIDDDKYILIDLDFDTADQAERFKKFLEVNVWSSPDASPGLAGTPQTRVLERVASDS